MSNKPPRERGKSARAEMGELTLESIVSGRDFRPYVHLQLGTGSARLEVDKAVELAFHLVECAEASMSDALIWRFFSEQLHMEPAQCAQIVDQFRQFRHEMPIARGWYAK